jgi:hypothetical protein
MRRRGEAGEGTRGGELGGREYAEGVNLQGGCKTDAPGKCGEADAGGPDFPAERGHQLGITNPVKSLEDGWIRRQDEGGGADRTGPGAAAGLVDACDLRVASIPKGLFVDEGRE